MTINTDIYFLNLPCIELSNIIKLEEQLFTEFDRTDKGSWLDITKTASAKDLSLAKSLSDTEKLIHIDPFLQEEDRIENPPLHSFPTQPDIGVVVSQSTGNNPLISYLENGASTLFIETEEECNFHELFKNINLNYIELTIKLNESLLVSFNTIVDKEDLSKINILNEKRNPLDIVSCVKNDCLITSLSDELARAKSSGIMLINLSDRPLLNISILRASRLFLQESGNKFKIASIIDSTEDEIGQQLIDISSKGVSAFMGGADLIYVSCQGDSESDTKKKLHTLNVMSLESKIHKVGDPTAGSYHIEHLTKKILQEI